MIWTDAFDRYLKGCVQLKELAEMLYDGGLVGRNFLLDESILPERAQSYGMPDPDSFKEWKSHHDAYLAREVFPIPPDDERPKLLDLDADPDLCPETFRLPARSPYTGSIPRLHLLRVVPLSFLGAVLQPLAAAQILSEAQVALGQPEHSAAYQSFDRLLGRWQKSLQLRPVYAAYWEDMSDLFGATSAQDRSDWADQMRDRLGLAHLDPGERGVTIDILVFRYAIEELPMIRQWTGSAPLMPPTVLDGPFSSAFCPAPANSATGHVVHLNGDDSLMRREVLHPAMDYHARHLWRVGQIKNPVRLDNLPTVRAFHLMAIREHCNRPDYAAATDRDLF